MDTFKEKQDLDDMYAQGNAPWEVWQESLADLRSADGAPSPALPAADLGVTGLIQPT